MEQLFKVKQIMKDRLRKEAEEKRLKDNKLCERSKVFLEEIIGKYPNYNFNNVELLPNNEFYIEWKPSNLHLSIFINKDYKFYINFGRYRYIEKFDYIEDAVYNAETFRFKLYKLYKQFFKGK